MKLKASNDNIVKKGPTIVYGNAPRPVTANPRYFFNFDVVVGEQGHFSVEAKYRPVVLAAGLSYSKARGCPENMFMVYKSAVDEDKILIYRKPKYI